LFREFSVPQFEILRLAFKERIDLDQAFLVGLHTPNQARGIDVGQCNRTVNLDLEFPNILEPPDNCSWYTFLLQVDLSEDCSPFHIFHMYHSVLISHRMVPYFRLLVLLMLVLSELTKLSAAEKKAQAALLAARKSTEAALSDLNTQRQHVVRTSNLEIPSADRTLLRQ